MRTIKFCSSLIFIFLCSSLPHDYIIGTENIKNNAINQADYSHKDTNFINKSGVPSMDFNKEELVKILYTNWKGVTSYRNIIPLSIEFKSSEWHKEKQWILNAYDIDKQDNRGFAIKDIKEWKIPETK